MPNMICLVYYMAIKQTFQYKTNLKAFTLKRRLKKGICLSPSEMNIWNSILQALLTHIRLINKMRNL